MNLRHVVILLVSVACIAGGFLFIRECTRPSQSVQDARDEVGRLTRDGVLRNGDIIFQSSMSGQSKAVQLATHSKYSHCGIVVLDGSKAYVVEAVQPVSITPLARWISHGDDGHYVVKRLVNADSVLTPETLERMKAVGEDFIGKKYDRTFEWSDDKIYCSELVWKIYKRGAGIEVGKLGRLRDFDLTHEEVKKVMKDRYGDDIPLNDVVISPVDIYNSDLLKQVDVEHR